MSISQLCLQRYLCRDLVHKICTRDVDWVGYERRGHRNWQVLVFRKFYPMFSKGFMVYFKFRLLFATFSEVLHVLWFSSSFPAFPKNSWRKPCNLGEIRKRQCLKNTCVSWKLIWKNQKGAKTQKKSQTPIETWENWGKLGKNWRKMSQLGKPHEEKQQN